MTFRRVKAVSRTLVHVHRFRVIQNFVLIAKSTKYTKLTLSQPRVGHIVPLRYTSWNISKKPSSTNLKLFWKFKWSNVQNKNRIFNCPCPWLPWQRPKLANVFEEHISAVLMQKLHRTGPFCYWHDECTKWKLFVESWAWYSAKWRTGDNFAPRSFSGFNDRSDRERKYYHYWTKNGIVRLVFFTLSEISLLSTFRARFWVLSRDSE